MDSKAQIAPADSSYAKRLNKIAAALGDNIDGTPANYKVYLTKDVNAWAMANGCIRVYSGADGHDERQRSGRRTGS
ncbi:Uncharacterized metalloprotease yggG [Serratia odorifera]|uniref:Uncharacterized metalloprotease yggG n=1 Tax=Serratia odorifera TaxID=618 RepID=A0A447KRZ1_SEROD|nr:Uncharacterized metalloprotease yggG [Serratia odorifera]